MPGGSMLRGPGHPLALFLGCERACRKLRELVDGRRGESSMSTLQRSVLRDLELMRDLPLRMLSERLKKFPFVDPAPFDEVITEMVEVITEWVAWVTHPDWLVEVLHRLGQHRQDGGDAEAFDLEEVGKFTYPMPLKLRELQAMIRPFMEVRSAQRVVGVDAIMAELVRALLRLFHTVKAWDDALLGHIKHICKAALEMSEAQVVLALAQLCAMVEMDPFETAHRLNRVSSEIFMITPGEIEVVCQKLPYYQDQGKVRGPPTLVLDHGGAQGAQYYKKDAMGLQQGADAAVEGTEGEGAASGQSALLQAREEAFSWWQGHSFMGAAPTRILASTVLNQLVDQELHPDPFVAEMLPRVLEKLFSEYMSAKAFMNYLLPLMGGYVDARGAEVPAGQGLPLRSDPERCAESLLVFLRQWSDLVLAAEEEDWKRASESLVSGGPGARRADQLDADAFEAAMEACGHSARDVVGMLEGAIEVPEEIIRVPHDERRYRVEDGARRTWEIFTEQFYDLVELVEESTRDLGPYVRVEIDRPETVRAAWGGSQPKTACCLTNPEIAKAARTHLLEQRGAAGGELPAALVQGRAHASDSLSLTLVEFPPELSSPSTGSTFVSFFAGQGRCISRTGTQGLPQLPWTLGSDRRNTIVVDVPGVAVAPFHCILAPSRAQPWRPCIVPTGSRMSPTYLVCPKYQLLEVHNGDRLVCQQWTFELRIQGSGDDHVSGLTILTDEGEEFKVPLEGCHVGAGNRSKQIEHQPSFPPTKFPLKHRLRDMAAVQFALVRSGACDRWMMVDHSPEPQGTLMLLRPGVAYPLSEGMRLKVGPLVLEVNKPDGS